MGFLLSPRGTGWLPAFGSERYPPYSGWRESTVKAVVFKKPYEVAVETVDDPRIEQPLDAIIRITTANICGSDLHPYEGRADLDAGMVLGHENLGIVEEVGPGMNRVKVGDRVSV